MFPERLETERLRLERFSHDTVDVLDYYEYTASDSEAARAATEYLPWGPHENPKAASDYVDSMEEQWDERTRAEYVIRPKQGEDGAGEFAGSAGLICRWEQDLALPAIWLRRRFWGRGYSGERADALLELAFERLDFSVVAIPLHGDNERSYRAVEKYVERHGGRYEGCLRNHAGRYDEPADHHRFSISREEYRAAKTDD
jgi:ribosomal-protein-alanine N-acetyltransferase